MELNSFYSYPWEEGGLALSVVERLWFISQENQQPVDLRTLLQFAGRVKYSCQHETCSLTIRELRRSDAALYRFRFLTNKESGKFTGEPGVNLTVTGNTRLNERMKPRRLGEPLFPYICRSSGRKKGFKIFLYYQL